MAFGDIIGRPGQGTHSLGDPYSDNAYDIAFPKGTPLVAVADGRIGGAFGYNRLGGWRLHLMTDSGEDFYYAHLDGYALGIFPGKRVRRGQVIGYSGDSGNARGTTPHLHIGGIGNIGAYIDDLIAGARGRALGQAAANGQPISFVRGVPGVQPKQQAYAVKVALNAYNAGLRGQRLYNFVYGRLVVKYPTMSTVQRQSLASYGANFVEASKTPGPGPSPFDIGGNLGAGYGVLAEKFGGFAAFLEFISTKEGWIRIAEVIGGTIILIMALRILMQGDVKIPIPGRG